MESTRLQGQAVMEYLQEEFHKHRESMVQAGKEERTKVEYLETLERTMLTQAGIVQKTQITNKATS